MAAAGHRVIYVAPHSIPVDGRGGFTIVSNPHARHLPDPAQGRALRCRRCTQASMPPGASGDRAPSASARPSCRCGSPVAVIEFPAWRSVGLPVPEATVVMDCLDHVAGFSNVTAAWSPRSTSCSDRPMSSSPARNDWLSRSAGHGPSPSSATARIRRSSRSRPTEAATDRARPIIGYFGAIEEWFEIGLDRPRCAHAAGLGLRPHRARRRRTLTRLRRLTST